MKVRKLTDVIGQSNNKRILLKLLENNAIPDVMWFKGASGSGKSTLAEWVALALTCESDSVEPCLTCDTCKTNLMHLDSQNSKSRYIKKINLAELSTKTEVKELIEQVFDLMPIPDKNTVYIFEELQELRTYQGMFLERLRDLPEGVHIIGCTTNLKALDEAFRTRAGLTLGFNALNRNECRTLTSKLVSEMKISNLTQQDCDLLITYAKNNARVITKTLETFKTIPDMKKLLREYLNIIPPMTYLEVLNSSFKDFASFIQDLEVLNESVDMLDFNHGFYNMFYEAVIYFYCGRTTLLSKTEKIAVNKIMNSLSEKQVRTTLKILIRKSKTEEEAIQTLFDLNEIFTSKPLTITSVKEETLQEERISRENYNKIEEKKKPKPSVEPVTLKNLANMLGETSYGGDIKW